jgi:hypothetical protein
LHGLSQDHSYYRNLVSFESLASITRDLATASYVCINSEVQTFNLLFMVANSWVIFKHVYNEMEKIGDEI